MNDTYVTLVGTVVTDVYSATTPSGVPLARFRFGVSPRKFDRETSTWTYGESSYYSVVAWRRLAEHTLSSVEKGDPLVITGRLNVRTWQRDDHWHTKVEVEASSLGHDLARGTARFTRARPREARPEQPAAVPPLPTTPRGETASRAA
ncbi:single-stranded DNA-binding protein [Yinghuangia sp. ASG 101]|uniref:single-stranded DNA-binding protein n=1 Tax=Yinghuangia sp. ASG 101 TaxID=2896848 RepID=UPI001E54E471|nr:single-stranded DNA-binding protein [Yinghuangia sp. ASG 101]UGQ09742.1 single-stranded DNA-binding protein [Yinghuangia sp. ASG 101]